jgi:hypothetical protein
MAHFYTAERLPKFLPEVETPAQAVKDKKAWPSVTTVLSIIKDDFIDSIFQPQQLVTLAREHPDMDWRDIKDMTYGFRKHPWTGAMIPSSEFGTSVHKRIEDIIKGTEDDTATPWDDWAMPFVQWVSDNEVSVMGTEYVIGNSVLKIAGSVDFIGTSKDGKIFLADYKTRKCKGKGNYYGKDCKQLAVEAWMLQQLLDLDYLPGCISVCICTETAEHYHKVWKDHDVQYHLDGAMLAAKVYWQERMTKATSYK